MQKSAEAGGTPLRIITAAAIFDGHDAAIGIFRRIFQSMGIFDQIQEIIDPILVSSISYMSP
jgi:methylmalonyl-CoA mutase cobalamin-binding subunit